MSELIGKTLGKFRLESELGRGGMGVVYQARHTELGRLVAIKVMHAQYTADERFRARFRQEAHITAQLNHPGIVTVTDFDEAHGFLYIVMEYIKGLNLQELLDELRAQRTWIGVAEAVQLISQVGTALHYAHGQGVLHRDIKPSNIMIRLDYQRPGSYQPVITDLGLARLKFGGLLTQPYSVMGTPAYMSPEQAKGETTDPRSDVYSLGILLYELTVGELPFPIHTMTEALRYHLHEQPPAPRAKRAELPAALEQVILRALAKVPNQRYASTAAMVQALSMIATDTLPTTAPPTAQATTDIFTQVQEQLSHLSQNNWFTNFPPPPTTMGDTDLIQVLAPDGSHWLASISAARLIIGRENDCTVKLPRDEQISRHHVRLERAGDVYQVTDLNSSNGVWLASRRLAPNQPEIWSPEEPLRLGRHRLRLLRRVVTTSKTAPLPQAGTQPDDDNLQPRPSFTAEKQSNASQPKPWVPTQPSPARRDSWRPPLGVTALLGVVLSLGLIAFAMLLRNVFIQAEVDASEPTATVLLLTPTLEATPNGVAPATATVAPPTFTASPAAANQSVVTPAPTLVPMPTPLPTALPASTAPPLPSPTSAPKPTSTPYVVVVTPTAPPTAPPTARPTARPTANSASKPTPLVATSKQGCYLIQNQLGPELTVTITKLDTQKAITFKIPNKQEHNACLDPGRYSITADAPPPWGTLNDTIEIHAGDNFLYPIRPGE